MKGISKLFKNKHTANTIILISFMLFIYVIISVFFTRHFFFNTVVNGVNVSLRSHKDADNIIRNSVKDYKLQLIERSGETEEIIGQDIELKYNEKNSISNIYHSQNSFVWIRALLMGEKYCINDLIVFNEADLNNEINKLNCLNRTIIEPKNVSFKYSNGSYEVIKEVYGNKINVKRLETAIKTSILQGEMKLNLNEKLCYENPKYTLNSIETSETRNSLNSYVKAKITYIFGNDSVILDGDTISEWLSVNENLEAVIDEKKVSEYVMDLCRKYDTVEAVRNFKTSVGKILEVKGGLYGWKINYAEETQALLENIELGEVLEKEPIYTQKALYRGKDEIGNTYVEINITRQHLWFYKNGRLVTQGDVVTGNPNRGNSTKLGVYMLNYKQKDADLTGIDYEAEVEYWMPFFGNIGIHDASWRYSFGGDIYKNNGTHGCVNAPLYLAKTIFQNIEVGTPIICYEE